MGTTRATRSTLGSSSRRYVDMAIVREHLTDEDLAGYATLGVKELEAIITEKVLGEGLERREGTAPEEGDPAGTNATGDPDRGLSLKTHGSIASGPRVVVRAHICWID